MGYGLVCGLRHWHGQSDCDRPVRRRTSRLLRRLRVPLERRDPLRGVQYCHDELLRVGGGKPISITENGVMPDIGSIGSAQPKWVYWATWWGFEGSGKGNTDQLYSSVYGAERTLTQDEVELPACQ